VQDSEPNRRAVATTLLPGFAGTLLPAWLAQRLRDGLGGVCVFGENIVSAAQLRELTDSIYAANPDALIAIDEEGGDVTRLHYADGSPLPGNAILGRIDDLAYTEEIGRRIGLDLRATGVNLNFAPDADINSNPNNPVIGVRSFGTSPAGVGRQVAAWTQGLQSVGVAACSKHFPGHGDTAQDSHHALPVIDRSLDELRERELVPFVAAIAAGTKSIMSSHIMLPQLDAERPATLSRGILHGLLRDELGFDGLIISDALDMKGASGDIGIPEAAVRALDAGCDLLCIGTRNTDEQLRDMEDVILKAIEDGRLSLARVEDAARRVRSLAASLRDEQASAPLEADAPQPGRPGRVGQDAALATRAFDVKPGVAEKLGQASELQLVILDDFANVAIGHVPWGITAELAAEPSRYASTRLGRAPVSAPIAGDDALVVFVGRNIQRHKASQELIDTTRANRDDVIVVDMGWPSDDRAYADIATFGASRLAGRALADYLTQTLVGSQT
jgi:beta-N-acetylhexosaminidase